MYLRRGCLFVWILMKFRLQLNSDFGEFKYSVRYFGKIGKNTKSNELTNRRIFSVKNEEVTWRGQICLSLIDMWIAKGRNQTMKTLFSDWTASKSICNYSIWTQLLRTNEMRRRNKHRKGGTNPRHSHSRSLVSIQDRFLWEKYSF